jgi:hypothetical protein
LWTSAFAKIPRSFNIKNYLQYLKSGRLWPFARQHFPNISNIFFFYCKNQNLHRQKPTNGTFFNLHIFLICKLILGMTSWNIAKKSLKVPKR